MDNGSSYETYEFVKPYLNDQVKYIRNPVNQREFVNTAFQTGSGEYLIITHDDDIMMPSMLKKEVEALEKDVSCVLVGCNVTLINGDGGLIKKYMNNNTKDKVFKKHEYIDSFFSDKYILPCPTILLRRAFFINSNLFFKLEIGPANDSYLWFEVNLNQVHLILLAEPLYYYRVHKNQDSVLHDYTKDILMFEKSMSLILSDLSIFNAKPYLQNIIRKLAITTAQAYKSGKITKSEFNNNLSRYKSKLKSWNFVSLHNRLLFFRLSYFLTLSLLLYRINVHFKKL
jgi:hypothetical protein